MTSAIFLSLAGICMAWFFVTTAAAMSAPSNSASVVSWGALWLAVVLLAVASALWLGGA